MVITVVFMTVFLLCFNEGESITTLDCSPFKTDLDILESFPYFYVSKVVYPVYFEIGQTAATISPEGYVTGLLINAEKFVPLTVFCLTHLQQLLIWSSSFSEIELVDSSLSTIPSEIGRLAHTLTSLAIVDTPVAYLPAELFTLTRLTSLELSRTGLQLLPPAVGSLTELVSLSLNENNITSLPSTIRQLTKVNALNLNENPLQAIDYIDGMAQLEILTCALCQIDRLPHDLPNLNYLYLDANKLENLLGIETIGYNTSVGKALYFDNNQIRSLPVEIEQVKNVVALRLGSNRLAHLPSEIYSMTELAYVELQDNLFTIEERQTIVDRFKMTHPEMEIYI